MGAQTVSSEVPPPNRSNPEVQTFVRQPSLGAQAAVMIALGAGLAFVVSGGVTQRTGNIVFGGFLLVLTVLISPVILVTTTLTIDLPYQRFIVQSKPIVPALCNCIKAYSAAWPLNSIASLSVDLTKRSKSRSSKSNSGPLYAFTLHFVDGSTCRAELAASNVDVQGRRRFAAMVNEQLQRAISQHVPGRLPNHPAAAATGAAAAALPFPAYEGQATANPYPPQGPMHHVTANPYPPQGPMHHVTANPYPPQGPMHHLTAPPDPYGPGGLVPVAAAGAGGAQVSPGRPAQGPVYGSAMAGASPPEAVSVKAPPEQRGSVMV